MQLVIVSGLSGAGKSVALKQYEDLGYYCIDNLPLALIGPLSPQLVKVIEGRYERLAVGIDARESPREIEAFPTHLDRLRAEGLTVQVLFLTASDEVILRRYAETRRKHPLTRADVPLSSAIRKERILLKPIADCADFVLDTGSFNLHELRDAIQARVPEAERGKLALSFESFGYKNGVPESVDFVFDVRCLPNPHWESALRPLTGRDPEVIEYLEKHADVQSMLGDLRRFLDTWLPRIAAQDRAYLTVAVGCTGGRHRSVYIVERLAEHFRTIYDPVSVKHRELSS